MIVPLAVTHPAFVDFYRHSRVELVHAYSFAGFWQTLLLANRWFLPDLGEWNGPTWSLSVELLAYFTFPLSAYLLARENSRIRCLIYSFGVLLLMICYLLAHHKANINAMGFNGIVRGLVGFSAGMALYRFCSLGKAASTAGKHAAIAGVSSCIILLVALLIPHASVVSLLCFTSLIGSLFFQRGVVNSILESRFVVFLGTISFSLYLIHFFPLKILAWQLNTGRLGQSKGAIPTYFLAYTVLVFGLSIALHFCVERPAQKAGRRLIKRLFSYDQDRVINISVAG